MKRRMIRLLGMAISNAALMLGCLLPLCHASESSPKEITLAGGLKEATTESRLVKIFSYNPEIAAADVSAAFSRFLPTVNATAGQTWIAYQPGAFAAQSSFFTANRSSFSYGVTATQTLFDFGARSSLYQAAKTSLESAKLDSRRVRNAVALDFITAYFTLLEIEKMEAVAGKEVESLSSHMQVAHALYEAGAITKNDLLQAKVRLSDSRQRLIALHNHRSLAVSSLNTILARPPGANLKAVEVAYELTASFSLQQAWDMAAERRNEVAAFSHEITAMELQERAKKAEYFPKLIASGGYAYGENRYQMHQDNWSLMLGLNMNIFSGGLTKAETSRIQHRRGQLIEKKRKLLDDIRLEVEQWYRNELNARERVAATKDSVEQAEENLRIVRVRYKEGVGTATDVLDAITLRTSAETNYFRALYDMRRSHAGLLHAIGDDLAAVYK